MIQLISSMVREGCPLIGVHGGAYQLDSDGEKSLGPGPFITTIEEATGITAKIMGKPTYRFFKSAVDSMGFEMQDAVMIGDVNHIFIFKFSYYNHDNYENIKQVRSF
jgi:ribonucleotide monophosphatase NagD (HAD superfamily)